MATKAIRNKNLTDLIFLIFVKEMQCIIIQYLTFSIRLFLLRHKAKNHFNIQANID